MIDSHKGYRKVTQTFRFENVKTKVLSYKMIFLIIVSLSTSDYRLPTASAAGQQGFYLGYKLSFYNLFSPGFHCFRRNHQFSFGYQNLQVGSSEISAEIQYNWIDEVKGSVSTHNLTSWVVGIKGTFNSVPATSLSWTGQDEVRLIGTYFVNLLSPWFNRGVGGLEYSRLFNYNNFTGMARAGIGFSRKFLPIYGVNLIYFPTTNTNVNLKFNWLEDNEDNPEFPFKFPLAIGLGGRFNSGLGLEYVWDPAKSHLVTAEGKLTHHWLKGYLGDKLWF